MKNVKSEALFNLSALVIELFESNALKKIVLSKPDASDEIKSVLSPKVISKDRVLQLETFSKDNKAYHRNIKGDYEKELLELFVKYSQINAVSTLGDAQYMRSKSGKESLIGANKIKDKLQKGEIISAKDTENNKQKNYILSGSEDFLKKLGVSDENGRIRDKMQAKFRQINRFIEHIEAIREKLPSKEINIYDLCC